jgi:thioesterase domain-containing protein
MASYAPPRDPFELQLVCVAGSVLGVEDVGIRDDLIELGMDEQAAAEIANYLTPLLGRNAKAEQLLQARKVDLIAQLYRELPWIGMWSSLAELRRRDGERLPLICVHPLGGNAFWYLALARRLRHEQAVYGLHARGLDLAEEVQTQVSEMAASYLCDLRRTVPRGPYALLGWSFGGVVAFEMARQLAAAETPVPILAMCDVGPQDAASTPSSPEAAFALLVHAVQLDAEVGMLMALEPDERLATLHRLALERQRLPPGYTVAHLERMLLINQVHLVAFRDYEFGRYEHDVILLRAGERDAQPSDDPSNEDLGWTGVIDGEVRIYPISGSHFDALSRQNLDGIAHCLAYEHSAATATMR